MASTAAGPGRSRIDWAGGQMPVLARIRERFARERPLAGVRVGASLHVTAETANLIGALREGGAEASLCAANPLSTQDEVAEALRADGVEVHARRGTDRAAYEQGIAAVAGSGAQILVDDGGDLIVAAHANDGVIGGLEETTTGIVRLRRVDLACPLVAVNDAHTERAFNDRHGTGQSALDGIVRATNMLIAGHTLVILGYGWTGKGIAQRARGAGAAVVVCEADPLRALEARMEGYEVMPALAAAERGDVFVTVTGVPGVLREEHFARMPDGAVLANAGHFDVEIDLDGLRAVADGDPRDVLPLVEEYRVGGKRLHLIARGRVVNLAAAEGHPAAVMDVSFAIQALCVEELVLRGAGLAPGIHPVPPAIDEEVARLKLAALGVEIDTLTDEQITYRRAFS